MIYVSTRPHSMEITKINIHAMTYDRHFVWSRATQIKFRFLRFRLDIRQKRSIFIKRNDREYK